MQTRRWPITTRQREILKIIELMYEENGRKFGPVHREIAARAKISQPSVANVINRLALHGYLERDPARGTRPVYRDEGEKAA